MPAPLLPTTVVGSYPQPDWLVDHSVLKGQTVPRVRLKQMWRVAEPYLEQAQDDATLIAIRDMERAGIDIVTDGEMRRESYSNRFATALDGIDDEHPAEIVNARGQKTPVPRVVGKIRRKGPVELRDMQFLRANTDKLAKITLPGPFTMGQQVKDEFYKDAEAMCMDYAAAVNEEAHALVKAGADVIQLDEALGLAVGRGLHREVAEEQRRSLLPTNEFFFPLIQEFAARCWRIGRVIGELFDNLAQMRVLAAQCSALRPNAHLATAVAAEDEAILHERDLE